MVREEEALRVEGIQGNASFAIQEILRSLGEAWIATGLAGDVLIVEKDDRRRRVAIVPDHPIPEISGNRGIFIPER